MSEESDVLAEILLQAGALSESQLELALADHDVSGIALEEVLFMRGWCTPDMIYSLAPWLKPGSKTPTPWQQEASPKKYQRKTGENVKPKAAQEVEKPKVAAGSKVADERPTKAGSGPPQSDYKENLQRYNEVVKTILGKDID